MARPLIRNIRTTQSPKKRLPVRGRVKWDEYWQGTMGGRKRREGVRGEMGSGKGEKARGGRWEGGKARRRAGGDGKWERREGARGEMGSGKGEKARGGRWEGEKAFPCTSVIDCPSPSLRTAGQGSAKETSVEARESAPDNANFFFRSQASTCRSGNKDLVTGTSNNNLVSSRCSDWLFATCVGSAREPWSFESHVLDIDKRCRGKVHHSAFRRGEASTDERRPLLCHWKIPATSQVSLREPFVL